MTIDGPWRTATGTQALMAALAAAGHRAWFVGGCVRDAVTGRDVGDVDIAADAHPEVLMEIAQAAGMRTVPTGIDHGTVTVVADGQPHEVTTLRRDIETDGRHAVVAFTDDLAQDAARRDLTMNALYATADGTVVDPLGGGLDDARAGRVRFVGDARTRIAEDYLRILRFFRFQAHYADPSTGIDAEGLAACADLAAGLDTLPAERIGSEMLRLLAAADPAPALGAMAASGILARLLPGALAPSVAVLVHLELAAGAAPDPIRRLAMLGAEGAADLLRLSRAQTSRLALLRSGIADTAGTAELAWRHGPDAARDVELLRAAGYGAPLPDGLDAEIARGVAAILPVTAADLMPELKGPALGRRLREIEARWLASGMRASRAELLSDRG